MHQYEEGTHLLGRVEPAHSSCIREEGNQAKKKQKKALYKQLKINLKNTTAHEGV